MPETLRPRVLVVGGGVGGYVAAIRAGQLARAKIHVVQGWARFSDAKSCTVETAEGPVAITADDVILATGSEASALPGLPFGGNVISSTEALSLSALPERLVVVGAGY